MAISTAAEPLPAFPGAEGFGAETPGGRGGKIIAVTNLNDSGPGSFRAACASKGPRIIVFRTGGTIEVISPVLVSEPFATIAGQTAPGDGILLKSHPGYDGPVLNITSHDVIVRGLRIRRGPTKKKGCCGDGLSIHKKGGHPHNIIIDHCSISWGTDENVDSWYSASNITIQWCLIAEALYDSSHEKGPHSKGTLIGADAKRVSYHHNLLAHNVARNPQFSNNEGPNHVINNVIYNWKYFGGQFSKAGKQVPKVNFIGNYYKPGPDTRKDRYEVSISKFPEEPLFYVHDNIGHHRPNDFGDQWDLVGDSNSGLEKKWMRIPASKKIQRQQAWPASPIPITIHPVKKGYELVLARAGATSPKRDAVDLRVVNDVKMKTGRCIDHPSEVGGWPTLAPGTPPVDTDLDGMPDEWEQKHKLDPKNPEDRNTKALSGYTWVEEYLNSLISFKE